MKTLKEIGISVDKNVLNNFETCSHDTHMEWRDDSGKINYDVRTVIHIPMGIILSGHIQSQHFMYEGGGMDLHEMQKPFKVDCFNYLMSDKNLHSLSFLPI